MNDFTIDAPLANCPELTSLHYLTLFLAISLCLVLMVPLPNQMLSFCVFLDGFLSSIKRQKSTQMGGLLVLLVFITVYFSGSRLSLCSESFTPLKRKLTRKKDCSKKKCMKGFKERRSLSTMKEKKEGKRCSLPAG